MIPMLYSLMPTIATTGVTIGPAFLMVMIALVVGGAWLGAGAAEELRRTAARERDARKPESADHAPQNLAA